MGQTKVFEEIVRATMKHFSKGNLFNKIPEYIKKEVFEVLIKRQRLSIKRILTYANKDYSYEKA